MYNQFFQNPEPEPKQEKVPEVNGYSGALANAANMAANSSRLVLDTCGTVMWSITTDSAKNVTARPWKLEAMDIPAPPTSNDIADLRNELNQLKMEVRELVHELTGNTGSDTSGT